MNIETGTATRFARVGSPLGELLLVGERRERPGVRGGGRGRGDDVLLSGVYFSGAPHAEGVLTRGAIDDAPAFSSVTQQLAEYFAGERTTFDVALAPRGTPFQREVWRALATIPHGETTTYAAIARAIGRPKAVRAVGAANGKNPISIIVPCHRVIGADGALTGYAGGIPNKRALLALESRSPRALAGG